MSDKMRETAERLIKIVLDQCGGYLSGPGYEAAQAARALREALAQPAPAVPGDVAKDAARYRWLRDESRPIDELFMATRADRAGTYRVSNEMDDIIDAAMLAAAPEPKS